MPTWTRIGDLYIDCDGVFQKLTDIPLASVCCDDSDDKKYWTVDFDNLNNSTFEIPLKNELTKWQRCVLFGITSKRDIRRAIRLAEKMRRKEYREGRKHSSYTLLTAAAYEISAKNFIKNMD